MLGLEFIHISKGISGTNCSEIAMKTGIVYWRNPPEYVFCDMSAISSPNVLIYVRKVYAKQQFLHATTCAISVAVKAQHILAISSKSMQTIYFICEIDLMTDDNRYFNSWRTATENKMLVKSYWSTFNPMESVVVVWIVSLSSCNCASPPNSTNDSIVNDI